MSTFRLPRARRSPALIACLALFLVGSNYCVLGAWSGNTGMACLTLPGAADASSPSGCHRCAPAPADSRTGDDEARTSCCPAPVVTPPAVSMDRDGAGLSSATALFVAVAATPSLQPASAWHGHRALPDDRPPTRLARAPVPARAPPLA